MVGSVPPARPRRQEREREPSLFLILGTEGEYANVLSSAMSYSLGRANNAVRQQLALMLATPSNYGT